jgi:hypothetical protein
VPLLLALGGCGEPSDRAGRSDPRSQEEPASPTFAADVAPLLARHCVECHRPDSVAPFPLVSYEDVRRRARQIVEVAASGYMPPWQPAPGFGEFRDERRLAAGEIEQLERWVAAGAPRGDASELPPAPEPASGWLLGEPDLTLTLGAPYVVPAGGPDLFRNLVLDVPLEERRWVRAVELLAANPQVVHHMTLLADQSGLARQLDALDEEPGYAGMEGGVDPGGHFIGWTPGKRPYPFPPGLAWTLEPGTDLVLQVHLLPSGKTEEVRPRIGLHFGDEPPTNEPVMLHLSSMTIDVPAGESAHPVRDELEVPVDVEALSIYPHAHYYCRSMDVFAVLPGGERVPLVRIDDWDFNWQDEYVYRRPIALPAGTTVHMHYVYDNSEANPRNPFRPPRRATWGASTYDAMADVWLKVVPRRREEVATLRQTMDRLDRQRLEEAYRQVLRRRPDDAVVRARLGHLLVARGDSESAIAHLERSLAERPGRWNALHDLGVARARLGELEGARVALVAALEGNPDYAASHAALASVLVLLERSEGAVPHYRRALELRPDDAEAHNNFGFVLARAGEDDEAERH